MRLLRYFREHHVVTGVVVLAVTQFAASVAGLIRDRLLAATFAQHLGVVDAYIAAFRPSDLLFQTTIMSALGTVLVPVLAQYHAKGKRSEVVKVLNSTMGAAALLFGAIALLLCISFPWLAPVLVEFKGDQLDLYIQFGRMALLTNFLFIFGNTSGQYLITVQRYWIYGITPILYTLGTIFGTLWLTPIIGPFGPMAGTVLGAVVYVILRFIAVYRAGGGFGIGLWHPDLREIGRLMLPRVLALGAFQVQLLFLDRLASGLTEGAVTINNYARNFQSVLVGVVGIAVAQSVYSLISQAAATKNRQRFRTYYWQGTALCLGLTIPGAAVLVLCSPIAAWLVHLQGYLHVFSLCLLIYSISIPFESLSHLQARAFYAMHDSMIPSILGVVSGFVAILVGYAFVAQYGIYAVAAGYTAGEVVQTTAFWFCHPKKEHRFMNPVDPSSPNTLEA